MKRFTFILFTFLLIFSVAHTSFAETQAEQETRLKQELEQIEKEKIEVQKDLDKTRQQSASIQRDVTIIGGEINKAQLNIKSKTITINRLGTDIDKKAKTIQQLDGRIVRGKESLAQLIKKSNEIDSYSLIEVVFAKKDMSEFFADVDSFNSIKDSMRTLFSEIRGTKVKTEVEKESLRTKRSQELDAKAEVEAEKRKIAQKEAEKKTLLTASKIQEKGYELTLAQKEARASAIRSALFKLRDSKGVDFGTALEYAKYASSKTGVRPAFILAILQQESNLGSNVGTCNRPGDPAEKGWKVIMKPTRDQEPFLALTTALGLNPDTVPLSCPWQGGWGGAMGPAQFIPSTWALYADKLSSALGVATANPWEPKHAFMASALYVKDLGAAGGTFSAERDAACRYYSGRRCDSKSPANTFYGNQVMTRATNIQENMIDLLSVSN